MSETEKKRIDEAFEKTKKMLDDPEFRKLITLILLGKDMQHILEGMGIKDE